MHCRICGKEILDDAFCEDVCQSSADNADVQAEQADKADNVDLQNEQYEGATEKPVKNPRTLGLGRAIAGAILATLASIFSFVTFIAALFGLIDVGTWVLALCVVSFFLVPSIVSVILSFVFGIRSLITFFKTKGVKPIATVILGGYAILASLFSLPGFLLTVTLLVVGVLLFLFVKI